MKENISASINPREMGYYSYEEAAGLLAISLRSVDTYCKKYNVTPKTGIIDNRKKFLTKKDIIEIFLSNNKSKGVDKDISAIDWNKVDERISAERESFAENTKDKIIDAETADFTIFANDDNQNKESHSSNVPDAKSPARYMDDFLGLKEASGKQEAVIEYQSKTIKTLSTKIKTSRIFIWLFVLIFLSALVFLNLYLESKERMLAEMSVFLQEKEKKEYSLNAQLKIAENTIVFAEKEKSHLQKINQEYQDILEIRKDKLQKMELILQEQDLPNALEITEENTKNN
ncbi:MAG: hypothetical protein P9X22_08180 [Candidatus Zapsychrus exili]|nr:hypothetical protein [Candidatus Zapsychrus exili]